MPQYEVKLFAHVYAESEDDALETISNAARTMTASGDLTVGIDNVSVEVIDD